MITKFKVFEELDGDYVICLQTIESSIQKFTVGKKYKIVDGPLKHPDIIDDLGHTITIYDITIAEPAHDKPSFRLFCTDHDVIEFGYPPTEATMKEFNLIKGRRKSTKQFDL